MHYLYILHSPLHDKYYVGITENPIQRLEQHNTQEKHSFTKLYRPWKMVALFSVDSYSEAVKAERFIKKQKSRKLIQKLIEIDFIPNGTLGQLVRVPYLRD